MNLPKYYWVNLIIIASHVLNRVVIQLILEKTPYDLLKGMKPNNSYFCIFHYKCFILNNRMDNLGKFDAKYDIGIFIG